jgi:hypothetical protein
MNNMVDFIGVGAQKSGTSWAYTCLYEHPQICAPVKEIHFFSRPRFSNGKQWYENHFRNCDQTKKTGEFSTSYLYSEATASRIHQMYPDAKLIAILRNPVDRALSQYRNAIKAGEIKENVSFESYLAQEKSVIEQGKYYEQLVRYIELFPKEQLLVLVYEDIKKDPKEFMQKIYRFLGVDDAFEASLLYKEVNIGRTPKSVFFGRLMHHTSQFLRKVGLHKLVHTIRKTGLPDFIHSLNTKKSNPIATVDRSALAKYFIEDTTKLSELLNRDLVTEWNVYETRN